MQKRNLIKLLVIGVTAISMLFTYSLAMAGHDCTTDDPLTPEVEKNLCWVFDLGYTVEVVDQDVLEGGLEKWTYSITKKKRASANHVLMGLEKDLVVNETETNESALFGPCIGDTTENIGVGDCLRQYGKWTPSFNTGLEQIILYVNPVENVTTVPIFAKGSSDTESGTIVGPGADIAKVIENTFIVDITKDGRGLAVKMDRNGNILSAEACEADCENYPINYVPIPTDGIALDASYFCIPAGGDFVANSTLDVDGNVLNLHCGFVEFKDEDSSIQFSNRGSCRVMAGRLICY